MLTHIKQSIDQSINKSMYINKDIAHVGPESLCLHLHVSILIRYFQEKNSQLPTEPRRSHQHI